MTATATAALTLKVNVLGSEQIKALSEQLRSLASAAQRAAGGGVAQLGRVQVATATSAAKAAAQQAILQLRVEKAAQSAAAAAARTAAVHESAAARRASAAAKAASAETRGIRTVEGEMKRLELLSANRAVTAQARQALGMHPSVLTGHGFVNRTRQTIGLMRDLTVAGMGVRFAYQTAAAGIGAIVGPVRDFQQQLAEVQTKGKFNASQMSEIAATAKSIGRTTQFGAREATSAAIELAASGLKPDAISSQLPKVLQFALAGGQDTGGAAMTLVETMSQFGLGADKFERIGDVLVKAANISTISVAEIGESMKYVGPIAKTAGIELEQMSAMIALLGERGIKGSMAGTSLRQMIVSLTHPARQAKQAMQAIGLTQKDMQRGLTDLPRFLVELDRKMQTRGMTQAQRLSITKRMFGSEALATVEALMKSMTDRTAEGGTVWESFRDQVQGADGDMRATAATMGNTLDGKIKRLRASVESAQIAIGEGLAPVMTQLLPKMATAAVSVGQWVGNNQDLVGSLAVAIPAIGGTTYAVNGLISAFSAVSAASKALGIASWGVSAGSAFGTSFIGAALPVIAAGIAGFGIGTLIAKAIDAEAIGAKIYEALHPEEAAQRNRLSVKDAMRRERDKNAPAPEAEIDDPILRNARAGALDQAQGLPEWMVRKSAQAAPWNGKLQIEITRDGRPVVAGFTSNGPELEVGTNVGP